VNDAVPISTDGLLTTADLAARCDFTLGLAAVSPSTRTVAGPGGAADVEPRVMQVLVVLAEAAGQVVTRGTLFSRCWGGVYVGDDSLNRTIGAIRKLAADIAGGSFEVETIPRTGYRLIGASAAPLITSDQERSAPRGLSRREVAGGAVGVMALGSIAAWSIVGSRHQWRFDALMQKAEHSIRNDTADDQTVKDLRDAASIRPDSARAWGFIAYLRSIDTVSADTRKTERARDEAQDAAARALALDPRQPYALLATFQLEGSTIDWVGRDARLRQIISIDPANVSAIRELVLLTQAAGMNRESWDWNERALAIVPFSVDFLGKRALKLWIAGRVSQADKVIDQVEALYPSNPWPQWVRFLICAMTGRPRAARAILDTNPAILETPAALALWRTFLNAVDEASLENIAKARSACVQAAETAGGFAVDTVMMLSLLGQVDTAFDIANGFLLSRGPVISKGQPIALVVSKGKAPRTHDLNDATWRVNTQYLFTPPCKAMRADARFLPLCEGMGLTAYWRARGVSPDYQVYG
jgi:DNA-binding winged helix-turn-helix (wHTH) protein/tetratricopeptide (TPR) repeat protein